MTDSVTINYSWAYPTNGADDSTWGTTLNATIIAIDASLKTVDNKTVGAALTANNLSDLASESTARTNLGLGSSAVAALSSAVSTVAGILGAVSNRVPFFTDNSGTLQQSPFTYTQVALNTNNLSDMASAGTSRTNLGLGSIATRNYSSGTGAPSGGSSGDLYGQHS